jgi:hypothetical protein
VNLSLKNEKLRRKITDFQKVKQNSIYMKISSEHDWATPYERKCPPNLKPCKGGII